MAKTDPTALAISKLAALKAVDDPQVLSTELALLLRDKSGYVVARAAQMAMDKSVPGLVAPAVDAMGRMMKSRGQDPDGSAVLNLANLLIALEADTSAEAVAMAGVRHEQWVGVMGGSIDVAVGFRGRCAVLLAAMGSTHATRLAVELLSEHDAPKPTERQSWIARVESARALTMINSTAAAMVLRFKAMEGDPEPSVLSECVAGVIAIEKQAGLEFAELMLDREVAVSEAGPTIPQIVLPAIGGCRLEGALPLLMKLENRFIHGDDRDAFFESVALTRREPAIAYLLSQLTEGNAPMKAAAERALMALKSMPGVAERIERARHG
jgi:hypothetical protein